MNNNNPAEPVLKNRLMMERRFYLNKSNSKWVTVGLKPAFNAFDGREKFTAELIIGGNDSVNFPVYGLSGFRTILHILCSKWHILYISLPI